MAFNPKDRTQYAGWNVYDEARLNKSNKINEFIYSVAREYGIEEQEVQKLYSQVCAEGVGTLTKVDVLLGDIVICKDVWTSEAYELLKNVTFIVKGILKVEYVRGKGKAQFSESNT